MKIFQKVSALILVVAISISCLFSCLNFSASADTSVEGNIAKLTEWQRDYLRVIRSLAIKNSYDTNVLASITASQALYEGGWARYGISVIANNQFGIKAYSNWDGKVFDNRTYMLYDSYSDLVRLQGAAYVKSASLWRAYDSWEESVADHSQLFYDEAKYAKVLAATDYETCAYEIVNAGYCSSASYAPTLIRIIEEYGLSELDDVSADVNQVVGLIMSHAEMTVETGETVQLEANAYPDPVIAYPSADESEEDPMAASTDEEESSAEVNESEENEKSESEISDSLVETEPILPFEIVWSSNAEDVATVDQNGKVTAVSQGIALITATYNGKEAACLVCVGTNGFVIDSDSSLLSEPNDDSEIIGRVSRGMPICIDADSVVTDESGNAYFKVTGTVSGGSIKDGYLPVSRVYLSNRQVNSVVIEKEVEMSALSYHQLSLYMEPQNNYENILWASSDVNSVIVTDGGMLIALGTGESDVIAVFQGGLTVTIHVTVCSDQSDVEPEPLPERIRYGIVNVDEGSSLNVRTQAGTSSSKLVAVPSGTEVEIHGDDISLPSETTYKTWYEISFAKNGNDYSGYVASDFILVTGEKTEENSDEPDDEPPEDTKGTILSKDFYEDFPIGMSAGELMDGMLSIVHIFGYDGNEKTSEECLKTGDQIRIVIDDITVKVIQIVLKGDVDGDGEITARDYMMLKRACLGTYSLDSAFVRAAMLSNEGCITATDYFKLKRHVLGTYSIFEEK